MIGALCIDQNTIRYTYGHCNKYKLRTEMKLSWIHKENGKEIDLKSIALDRYQT